jgi:outer membrane protein TolC
MLACLCGTHLPVHGQAAHVMSLQECIELAQRQSPEAMIARKGYESVYWSYRAFRAGLLPQLRLDLNAPGILRTISQITQDDGTLDFVQQNQAFSNGSLSLTQQIAPTGGTVFVSSGLNRLDVFGTNAYVQYQARPVLVGVSQPLMAFNNLRWQQRLQPLRFRLAEKRYLEALEDIAVSISGLYFDVYIAQITLNNALSNEGINDSIYNVANGRYRVGKIAENDLLQTELAYLNAQADANRNALALQKAKVNLAIALGIRDAESIQLLPPQEVPTVEIDEQFALSQANENRSDIVDFSVRQIEAESAVAQARATNRFSADINATFGLNQAGTTITQAYTQPLAQQTATLGISVPILQWGRGKAEVSSAKVEQSRAQEQIRLDQRRLERDVRFQVLDFAQLQVQMRLASKSDTIAIRRYEVAKNRYLIGKIDITNLQIAQNEKDNARASYIGVLRQFWVAYYQLRRSTLYDFIEQMPLVVPELEVN